MARGTPFAAAHTFAQTGPFRPSTLWGENIVFTGSGTQPGVGVPMVLISGRLAGRTDHRTRPRLPLPGLALTARYAAARHVRSTVK